MNCLLALCALVGLLVPSIDADIVINEIMYHHPANEMFEFVELFNNDAAATVNMQGWRIRIGKIANTSKKEKKVFAKYGTFFRCAHIHLNNRKKKKKQTKKKKKKRRCRGVDLWRKLKRWPA
jgi:hypothetical protein